MRIIEQIRIQYSALSISTYTDGEAQWVMITGSVSTVTPFPGKPVPNPRMVVRFPFREEGGTFTFEVNFTTLCTGVAGDLSFHGWLQTMLPDSRYDLCPGVTKEAVDCVGNRAKSIRRWGYPFERVDHNHCQLWIPTLKVTAKWNHAPTCEKRTQLYSYAKRDTKTKAAITPNRKGKRLQPSSNYPLSQLSPTSTKKRLA